MYEPKPDDINLPPTQPIDLSWLVADVEASRQGPRRSPSEFR